MIAGAKLGYGLERQIKTLAVRESRIDLPNIDFSADLRHVVLALLDQTTLAEARYQDVDGVEVTLMLFADHGLLKSLEYAKREKHVVDAHPDVTRLDIRRASAFGSKLHDERGR